MEAGSAPWVNDATDLSFSVLGNITGQIQTHDCLFLFKNHS